MGSPETGPYSYTPDSAGDLDSLFSLEEREAMTSGLYDPVLEDIQNLPTGNTPIDDLFDQIGEPRH